MIQPGLARIGQLLRHNALPWRAVHVAGTNGKGSVCAYVSAMLHAANIKTGRFTSPHLIDRWDCITIEEKIVDETTFRQAEEAVKSRDSSDKIGASEFETLTATAFTLFAQQKVEVAIVEVGLGGRQDATNIIEHPLVTILTHISKDHQSLLGGTIEEIASHKAGIMKRGAPCVVDASNSVSVMNIIEATARETMVGPVYRIPGHCDDDSAALRPLFNEGDWEPHQQINVSLAYCAAKTVLQQVAPTTPLSVLSDGARRARWPGRLQSLDIAGLTGRKERVLLDGAHNAQSAMILGSSVNKKLRTQHDPVTWVVALSKGKDLRELLSCLCQSGDNIVATEFSPVDRMPWVSSTNADAILETARLLGINGFLVNAGRNVMGALETASGIAAGGPMVICGSLYLVSDVLRLLQREGSPQVLL